MIDPNINENFINQINEKMNIVMNILGEKDYKNIINSINKLDSQSNINIEEIKQEIKNVSEQINNSTQLLKFSETYIAENCP